VVTDAAAGKLPGQLPAGEAPVFDLLASKLRRPLIRTDAVGRGTLIERLAQADSRTVVSVVAPAGCGKTTLLSQWADRSGLAVAWVSVDEKDNDPKVLLTYIARALDAVQPLGDLVFQALASPASSVPGSVVPRLANALSSITAPMLLIVDDVHLLTTTECRAALSVLAEHVPAGSRLVLAGREEPPVRLARLRAEGRIVEIGPAELALSREEASALLRAAQVKLGEDEVAELHRQTEGWAAGLYLAALSIREGGSPARGAISFDGADRLVSQYVESEFLSRLPAHQRAFLTRSAVLERMSGPLCDAVLGGQWFRYHHLFGAMLRAELERREPEVMRAIQRRTASWCMTNDQPEEALEYAMAAQDVDTAARLAEQLWLPVYWRGGRDTLERWVRWLDQRGAIREHPMIAVMAGYLHTVTGRPVEAERWANLIDHWQYEDGSWAGELTTEAFAATLRAVNCRHGVEQLRADVDEARRKNAAAGIATPNPAFYQGIACILAGEPDRSDPFFREAIAVAKETSAGVVLVGAVRTIAAGHGARSLEPGGSAGRRGHGGGQAGNRRGHGVGSASPRRCTPR
jgi:LuxR family maltose regulon positive regulatory protein